MAVLGKVVRGGRDGRAGVFSCRPSSLPWSPQEPPGLSRGTRGLPHLQCGSREVSLKSSASDLPTQLLLFSQDKKFLTSRRPWHSLLLFSSFSWYLIASWAGPSGPPCEIFPSAPAVAAQVAPEPHAPRSTHSFLGGPFPIPSQTHTHTLRSKTFCNTAFMSNVE